MGRFSGERQKTSGPARAAKASKSGEGGAYYAPCRRRQNSVWACDVQEFDRCAACQRMVGRKVWRMGRARFSAGAD